MNLYQPTAWRTALAVAVLAVGAILALCLLALVAFWLGNAVAAIMHWLVAVNPYLLLPAGVLGTSAVLLVADAAAKAMGK